MANRIEIEIRAKSLLGRALNKAGASISKFAKSAVSAAKKAAVGIAALAASAIAVGAKMIKLYQVQAQAEAKLSAVIKATGYAAGITASEMKDHAAEMQKATGIGDEITISMQAVLATFREIKGDNFKRATEAILDMSVVMKKAGQDSAEVEQGAIRVGKALNDPIRGISALSRVGVQFTTQQRDQIRAMQEAGDIAGAQRVILAELEAQFGGAARAQNENVKAWNLLKSTIGDFGERIGQAMSDTAGLAGVFERLTKILEDLANEGYIELWAERVKIAIESAIPGIHKVGKALGWIKEQIGESAAFYGSLAGGASMDDAVRSMYVIPAQVKSDTKKRLKEIQEEIAARKAAAAAREKDEMAAVQVSQSNIDAIDKAEKEADERARAEQEEEIERMKEMERLSAKLIELEKRRADIMEDIAKEEAVINIDRQIADLDKQIADAMAENIPERAAKQVDDFIARRKEIADVEKDNAAREKKLAELAAREARGQSITRRGREMLEQDRAFKAAVAKADAARAEQERLQKTRDLIQRDQLQELRDINRDLAANLKAA
jgi:hypothetical protein